jgi:tRNA A-37 threonylcarbamoyl transferase component Bud32
MRKEETKGLVMHWSLLSVISALLLVSACKTHKDLPPTQEEAARVVQQALSLQEEVTAEELHGGLSGTKIFLVKAFRVSDGCQQYVVRFLTHPHTREPREITCLRIASNAGYGPHLYAVAPDWKWTVMEYVQPQPVTKEDRASGRYYQQLGAVISKMHHGPSFPVHRTVLEDTALDLRRIKKRSSLNLVSTRLEQILPIIQEALVSVGQKAPCHDDLNPGNMIWTGSTFKIIDFAAACQDDPYFDLATIIQFNCFCAETENQVLTAYFLGSMTKEERAHLFLMKQAVRIAWTVRLLLSVPDQTLEEIDEPHTFEAILNKLENEELTIEDPKVRAELALSLFSQLNRVYDSKEFQEAIDILTGQSTS